MAPPKEPALSRRHRHRAPGTASRGAQGSGATRHTLSSRNRSRLLLLLGLVCGALLIAAPIAIVVTDGPEAGPVREPEGVFTGGQNPGTNGGTGSGSGPGGGSLATTSSQSPLPAATGDQAAGGAGGAGGPVVAGSGAAAPLGSPSGGGTAAGAYGGTPTGGGSQPATQQQPTYQQPTGQQPTTQQPATQPQQQPTQQQPTQQPTNPCLCETVGDTVDEVGDVLAPVTGAVPLPGLP